MDPEAQLPVDFRVRPARDLVQEIGRDFRAVHRRRRGVEAMVGLNL